MKMPRKKDRLSTEMKAKIVLMMVLCIILVGSIIWKATKPKENQYNPYIETESESLEENFLIFNLDEFATPLLENDAQLLEKRLKKYVEGMGKEISSAEIIYVAVADSEEDSMDFYLKLAPGNEIVKLTYVYKDSSVIASACEYTEEEIKNEIWNEGAPAIRDMQ